MNIYTHYALWRDRVAAAGLVDRFSVCVTIGCGFLPEGAEVVERAVHVVEARRRLARQRVERPVHRRERGRGDFRGLCVELNLSHAPREVLVRVGDGRLRLRRAQPAALPLDAVQTVGARRARLG